MDGPHSSYSSLEIHICWKVDRDETMEPPIHTEYFRSGGAMTLTFTPEGAREVSSFCIRSTRPENTNEMINIILWYNKTIQTQK